jgi:hypothetical protein
MVATAFKVTLLKTEAGKNIGVIRAARGGKANSIRAVDYGYYNGVEESKCHS